MKFGLAERSWWSSANQDAIKANLIWFVRRQEMEIPLKIF